MNNLHYFYVLQCNDGTYYAGYTINLSRRVAKHNAKKGAKYTKVRTPVTLYYFEVFTTKQEAMRREYAFKQLTRLQKQQQMKG